MKWAYETAPSTGCDPGLRSGCADGEFHRRRGRAGDDPGGRLLSGQKPRGAARRAAVRAREGTGPADPARALACFPPCRALSTRSRRRSPAIAQEDESLLTITTTHTFANTWLAWRLGAFQMEHTDLAVRMTTSNEVCDLRAGRRRRRDPRRRRRLGGDRGAPPVRIRLHAHGQPGVHRAVERRLGRQARARRHSRIRTASIRATTGGSNGSPTMASRPTNRSCGAPGSGSRTRPTRAMRRWPARVSPC